MPHAEMIEHKYHLQDSKSVAWLWLTLKSRAKAATQLPLYYDADPIAGAIEVNFDKASGVKRVSIAVVAGVTAVGQEDVRFLEISRDVWNAKTTPPPAKAAGRQLWQFSLALPSEISMPGQRKTLSTMYKLPPSFSERASPVYIDYRVVATVHRGLFKSNQTLSTGLVFLPVSRSEAPPPLREAAYRDGTALIGPDGDPEGWNVLPPAKFTGALFNTRQVELQCVVAVAKPLSFARGSAIPLFVTISSTDEQALDLLASPGAVKIYLIRYRVLGTHATEDKYSDHSSHVFHERVGAAYFWPSTERASGDRVRMMQGELNVEVSSKPSFIFPEFSLRYKLALFPPHAPGFSSKLTADKPLVVEEVTVTTAEAAGVYSRSYAPPGYMQPVDPDYNNTVGYLENGNQRFMHHGGHGGI
ncbi:uncharacterized protein FIBRA_01302 [Fibroporia radiculosa]|uniref:Arrestin-like N-terminal domain-containing protein n=1 Tax=Fibroporia radiculosa TaxID=599839 RepID=J4I8E8_9APHY|nr:uncharacterized protein FIBRA_01302 [Fibroporia radiculosa]CCL99286.1 predicted protein [Fibroporia radiculosa]